MAWGRQAPHTVETERPGGDGRAFAETERLGIDTEVTDRPAHAWEVDEAESWEPVVPDTWDPPTDADADAGGEARGDEAAWSDAARRGSEWATAAVIEEAPVAGREPQTVRPADRDAASIERPADEPVRSPEPAARPDASARAPQPPLTRMALGLASLAAQRMRGGMPAGDGLVTGFGVLRHTANGLMALGERMIRPASHIAAGAVKGAATLPLVGAPIRAGLRSQRWLASTTARARDQLARLAAGEPVREPAGAARSRPAQPSTVDYNAPAEQL